MEQKTEKNVRLDSNQEMATRASMNGTLWQHPVSLLLSQVWNDFSIGDKTEMKWKISDEAKDKL